MQDRSFSKIYRSPYFVQRGYNSHFITGTGLNSTFRGIFSALSPLFFSGLKSIGRETLKGGLEVLDNIGKGEKVNTIIKKQATKRINNLQDQLIKKVRNNLVTGEGLRKKRKATKRKIKKTTPLIRGIIIKKRTSKLTKRTKQRKSKKGSKKKQQKVATDIFS